MTKIKERLEVFRAEAQISAWGEEASVTDPTVAGNYTKHASPFGSSTEAVVSSFDGNLRVERERPALARGSHRLQ